MDVEELLREAQSLRQGHFVFKSGKHCASYCRPDDLIPHTRELWLLADVMAEPFLDMVQVVIGAHFGGNALAQMVAQAMCLRGREIVWVATARGADGQQIVEPNRDLERHLRGKPTLVVDDISATGESPGQVAQLARGHGAVVVGVSVIAAYCDNQKLAKESGVKKAHALHRFEFQTYEASECPMCKRFEPIVADRSLGHGWEFQQEHPDYPGGYVSLLS